jgi:hypothetical protein
MVTFVENMDVDSYARCDGRSQTGREEALGKQIACLEQRTWHAKELQVTICILLENGMYPQ